MSDIAKGLDQISHRYDQNLSVNEQRILDRAIDQLRWRRVERPEPGFFSIYPHLGIEWLLHYSVDGDPVIEVETMHHGLPDDFTARAIAWRPVDLRDLPEDEE